MLSQESRFSVKDLETRNSFSLAT